MPQAVALALFKAGAPLFISNFLVSATGALVFNVAAGFALNAVANALRPKAAVPGPSDVQNIIRLALAPRVKGYGTVRTSGALVWIDVDPANPRDLYQVFAFHHGKISEVVAWHFDDNTVEIDGSGNVTTDPYQLCDIFYHLGEDTETEFAALDTAFGLPEMRGDGAFTAVIMLKSSTTAETQISNFPNGLNTLIRATYNASLVWDPRDSAQDREDDSTWAFSDNAVVCWLNYLLDPDGYGMPWSRFENNIAEWMAAMDVADEEVELSAGGTGRRYRIALTYRLTDDPKEVSDRFAAACDGRIWQKRDGSIGVAVGVFTAPTITIGADAIIGYSDLTRGQDLLTKVAGVRASFMSPTHDYREHEAEPYPDAETVLALGEERVDTLDLTMVPADAQTRRLMKRHYLRRTAEWSGTITTNVLGIRALDERYINVEIPELGLDTSFEVQSFAFDPSAMQCTIGILSVDSSIDDWDPSEESAPEGDAELSLSGDVIYSKAGTALDPIAEAGGTQGQSALVLCAGATLAAAPAGWTAIDSAGPTGGLAVKAYIKQLDGTETSTSFLGTSGLLFCGIFDGMLAAPTFIDKDEEVTGSIPSAQTKNGRSPSNYVVAALAAGLSPVAGSADAILSMGFGEPVEDYSQYQENGAISGAVKLRIFGAGESTSNVYVSYAAGDLTTNALMSFIIRPGA